MKKLHNYYRYEVLDKDHPKYKDKGWSSLDKVIPKEIGLCKDIINLIDLYITPPNVYIDLGLLGEDDLVSSTEEQGTDETLLERNFRAETVWMAIDLLDQYGCIYNSDDVIELLMIFENTFGKLEDMIYLLYNNNAPQWKAERSYMYHASILDILDSIITPLRSDHHVKNRIWDKYLYCKTINFINYFCKRSNSLSCHPPKAKIFIKYFAIIFDQLAMHMGYSPV